MFAPLFATVMAKIPLKGMGFKPKLKGNIPYIVLKVENSGNIIYNIGHEI